MKPVEKSLLVNLANYKPTEKRSSEENFSTEALCHLLKHSIRKRSKLFASFLSLFGQSIELDEYENVTILTQKAFSTSDGRIVIPDILIEIQDRVSLVIEVKVESGINNYEVSNKEIIDQVEMYRRISSLDPKQVCLLTKYIYLGASDVIAARWNQVSQLLLKYESQDEVEDFLVNDISIFLKEKGMSIPKVSYEILKGMESLCNLFEQLELILEGYNTLQSFGYNWLGYYIINPANKNEKVAWVGTIYDGEKLSLTIESDRLLKVALSKYKNDFEVRDDSGKLIGRSDFIFEDNCYFCLKPEKQIEVIKNWIKKRIDLLLKENS